MNVLINLKSCWKVVQPIWVIPWRFVPLVPVWWLIPPSSSMSLYWFHLLWCHLHLLSWIWTLHCDWDIWFPSCTFIAGDSALHGYLVISSKFFVLILLKIVWCRAELSALHHVSSCWNSVLAERDVLENEHEVWGSFVNQKNFVQNICNH